MPKINCTNNNVTESQAFSGLRVKIFIFDSPELAAVALFFAALLGAVLYISIAAETYISNVKRERFHYEMGVANDIRTHDGSSTWVSAQLLTAHVYSDRRRYKLRTRNNYSSQ